MQGGIAGLHQFRSLLGDDLVLVELLVSPIADGAVKLLRPDCVVLAKVAAQEMFLKEVRNLVGARLPVEQQDLRHRVVGRFSDERKFLQMSLGVRQCMPLVNEINRLSNAGTKNRMRVHLQKRQESIILVIIPAETDS